jgi:transposase
MPKKKYIVNLNDAEREQLQQLLRFGKHPTRKVTRARILLKAADGCTDDQIAAALSVGRATIERLRGSFVERGLDALNELPRPGKKPKLDAKAKARLIAEACSNAPEGRGHWTMLLIADQLVDLKVVETISDETVRRTLKKTRSSRG